MPMAPASNPLDAIERMEVENTIEAMRGFKKMAPFARQKLVNALAGHTLRLWAEVLRLEEELKSVEKISDNRRIGIETAATRELNLVDKWHDAETRAGLAQDKLYAAVELLRELDKTGSVNPEKIRKILEANPGPVPMCQDPIADIISPPGAPPDESPSTEGRST